MKDATSNVPMTASTQKMIIGGGEGREREGGEERREKYVNNILQASISEKTGETGIFTE